MVFNSLKRLFGLDTSKPSEQVPNPAERAEDRLVSFRPPLPPDINQFESEFRNVHEFMEHQMRALMGSFGFQFGSPFAGFGFGDHFEGHPSRPIHPDISNFSDNDAISQSPASNHAALDPRDEVLKPQFRSKSSGTWNGQNQILDERLESKGPGSIIVPLNPFNEDFAGHGPLFGGFPNLFGGGLFRNGPFGQSDLGSAPESGSIISSGTVTIYSNVNGRTSIEKITRHPDGVSSF